MENEENIPCTMQTRIKCLKCGRISLVKDLIRKKGRSFPAPHGSLLETVYYHCKCDEDEKARVYGEGEGAEEDKYDLIIANPEICEIVPPQEQK